MAVRSVEMAVRSVDNNWEDILVIEIRIQETLYRAAGINKKQIVKASNTKFKRRTFWTFAKAKFTSHIFHFLFQVS